MARILSLRKIATGDKLEQAKLLYSIAPRKFAVLMAQQGFQVDSIEDIEDIFNSVSKGTTKINFNKILRALPINKSDLSRAGQSGIKLI